MYFKRFKNVCVVCLCFIFFVLIVLASVYMIKKDNYSVLTMYAKKEPNPVISREVLEEENNKNPDIKGIIQIDGTDINDLVVQGGDNSYYLNRDINKKHSKKGSIFLDYRTYLDSKKILIYGHSSTSFIVSFNELEKYYDKDFFDSHKYISFITKDVRKNYEIFSVVIETEDWSYMNINFATLDDWHRHLKKWKNKSLYETGVDVLEDDNIIILQTCSHHKDYKEYKKKYLLVMAREIK